MAYAGDLKSPAPKGACGFDPHPGHQQNLSSCFNQHFRDELFPTKRWVCFVIWVDADLNPVSTSCWIPALSSTLHCFETRPLTREENPIGLIALNRETAGQVECLDSSDCVMLAGHEGLLLRLDYGNRLP
jgi:hypothetical protein